MFWRILDWLDSRIIRHRFYWFCEFVALHYPDDKGGSQMSYEMTEEDISLIGVTEDEVEELEQQATIGIAPNDEIAYRQNFQLLFQEKLKTVAAFAAQQKMKDWLLSPENVERVAKWLYNHDGFIGDWYWKESERREKYLQEARSLLEGLVVGK